MSGSWKKDRRDRAELEYNKAVSEQETIYRDLFGEEELREVRKKGFTQSKSYLQYLKEEMERKLREQDGD